MGLSIQTGSDSQTEATQESSLTNQEVSNETTQETATQEATTETNSASAESTQVQTEQTVETTEATSTESDSGQEDVVDLNDEVALQYLSQSLGREFTLDQLKSFDPNDTTEAPEFTYSHDEVAQLDKFVRETKRSPEDYYKMRSLNTENLSDLEVVRLQTVLQNPNASDKEIDAYLKTKYGLSEDDGASETEIAANQFELKSVANTARQQINNLQQTYMKPIEAAEASQGLSETELAQIRQSINQGGDSIGEIEFGDKVDWKFGITDEARSEAVSAVQNMNPEQLSMYADENGNIDYQAAVGSEMILQNIESIADGIWTAAQDSLRAEMVKERKNINVPEQTGEAPQNNLTERQAIVQGLRNSMKGSSGLRIQTGN